MDSRRARLASRLALESRRFLFMTVTTILPAMIVGQSTAAADRGKSPGEKPSAGKVDFIDKLLEAAWKKAGVRPARTATEEEFLRRAYLDLVGRIPSVEEARSFLQTKE